MSTQSIDSPQGNSKANKTFYLTRGGFSTGSDFIYDETYKNYKTKQKFQKDPKYSYFNAVMQMKRKLSSRQQLYNNVFKPKSQLQSHSYTPNNVQNTTFYNNNNHNSNEVNNNNKLALFYEPLDYQVVKIQQLKKNSFKIVKQQTPFEPVVTLRKQQSDVVNAKKKIQTSTYVTPLLRSGHKSNMSLYERPASMGQNMSFQMTNKERNNRSYVQLQIKQQVNNTLTTNLKRQPHYQPTNPKPRLDEIMSEYRKINKHSHPVASLKSRRSSLPKQFVQRLYQTNKMFYNQNHNKKRVSIS